MTLSQPDDQTIDAQDQPVPYTLTPLAEALLNELPDASTATRTDAPYAQWEPTSYELTVTDDPEPEIG